MIKLLFCFCELCAGGRRYQGLLSPRLGSVSPTFPYPSSPTGILSPSSDSSGISSKKSSFDNFQLDGMCIG